jgi:hypothetical protein
MAAPANDDKKVKVDLTLEFPLADGRTVVKGPLTYEADGLYTMHNCDFIDDPRFAEAYRLGANTGHHFRKEGEELHIEWRMHTILWAATHAAKLQGDFVECGVNTGIYSRAIMYYIDFKKMTDRRFFLLDTYEGIPESCVTDEERKIGLLVLNRRYPDCYEQVKETFAEFENAVIIKGIVPDTLAQVDSDKVAYLSIDMNAANPEVAAMEHFWEKLVPGGVVVLDDYGFRNHYNQRNAMDALAKRIGFNILALPTGQGLILKD